MSLLFSGCLGLFEDDPDVDDGDGGTGTDGGNGNQTADGNQTDDGDKTGNGNGDDNTTAEPPEASLSANVTSGSAPLSVEFELDNDNDAAESVSWSLDLGEGDPETGDELPATVEHTFEDVGNYTVVLTLTSGDEEDTAEVTITVEAEGGGGANDLVEGTNGLCLDYNVLYEVPGVEDPLATRVEQVEVGTGIEVSSEGGFVVVDFFDADGATVGYYPSTETVPEGATYGIVCVGLEEGPGYPAVPVPNAAWTYQDGF